MEGWQRKNYQAMEDFFLLFFYLKKPKKKQKNYKNFTHLYAAQNFALF